ncbi:hormone-sensitive lipase [Tetranychus urticae]|uniref:Alpha/beta hydrolase fold-3 domain-containing protein n=1 Tax=Tetranychus urticae TaxID=32264 RepID=T1KXT8_TETUR|nr:hormone-sensitive lipase [Tetranychus urticae]
MSHLIYSNGNSVQLPDPRWTGQRHLGEHSVKLIKEMDHLTSIIEEILRRSDCPHLTVHIETLREGGHEIACWAPEYDFGDIHANGYWSLLTIGLKLCNLVVDRYQNDPNPIIDNDLKNLLDFANIAIDVVRLLRKDSIDFAASQENTEPSLQASSLKYFVDLFGLLLSIEKEKIAPAFGQFCGFWLSPQSQYATTVFVTGLSLLSARITDGLKCIISRNQRGLVFAELVKRADVSFVTKLRNLLESPFYKTYLPIILYGRSPKTRVDIYFNRQTTWIISPINKKVLRFTENHGGPTGWKQEKIRCRLFQSHPLGKGHENKLVIYCHGGGFTMGSPESQEIFIRDWANKLDGIPILSVNYTLAPEAKFPVAIQEILDVYLSVTNEKKSPLETFLGYKPTQITLVGDSAGGNLCTSLCMVLNDIRLKDADFPIQMPNSLISFYAPFNITLLLSPSITLASCDSLLSAGLMLSCFEAYLPITDETNSHNNTESTVDNNALIRLPNLVELVKNVLKSIKDIKLFQTGQCDPWYRAEKAKLQETVEKLYKITSNPYISPLYYQDFESLASINLHLIALHFDPFLDDNVTMAKKWKGKVTLDVLDGLQHGFLNYMPFIDEGRKANELAVRRIKETFK